MEELEAWLAEQGIAIAGQVMTGSGNMVRLRLRLLDGSEVDVAFAAELLVERPSEAIRLVRQTVEDHAEAQRTSRNN